MKKVRVYTDGACSGNPGRGGWCAILIYAKDSQQIIKEVSGSNNDTTNNQMELTAVIEAINFIKEPVEIDLYTDSKYVIDGATKWIHNWIMNDWKTSNKKSVANKDLWMKLLSSLGRHNITWHWVKGHGCDKYNNRCDEIARKLARENINR